MVVGRGGMSWWHVVVVCRGGMSWWHVLVACCGGMSWWYVVVVGRGERILKHGIPRNNKRL